MHAHPRSPLTVLSDRGTEILTVKNRMPPGATRPRGQGAKGMGCPPHGIRSGGGAINCCLRRSRSPKNSGFISDRGCKSFNLKVSQKKGSGFMARREPVKKRSASDFWRMSILSRFVTLEWALRFFFEMGSH